MTANNICAGCLERHHPTMQHPDSSFFEVAECGHCGKRIPVIDLELVMLYTGLGLHPLFVAQQLPRLRIGQGRPLDMTDIGRMLGHHLALITPFTPPAYVPEGTAARFPDPGIPDGPCNNARFPCEQAVDAVEGKIDTRFFNTKAEADAFDALYGELLHRWQINAFTVPEGSDFEISVFITSLIKMVSNVLPFAFGSAGPSATTFRQLLHIDLRKSPAKPAATVEQLLKITLVWTLIDDLISFPGQGNYWLHGTTSKTQRSVMFQWSVNDFGRNLCDAAWERLQESDQLDRPLSSFLERFRSEQGFYENPDFPFVEPISWLMADAKESLTHIGGGLIFQFKWHSMSVGSIATTWWRGQLLSANPEIQASCGGIAYHCISGDSGLTIDELLEAESDFAGLPGCFLDSMPDTVDDVLPMVRALVTVRTWERHEQAAKGQGINVLMRSLMALYQQVPGPRVVAISSYPRQFCSMDKSTVGQLPSIDAAILTGATAIQSYLTMRQGDLREADDHLFLF